VAVVARGAPEAWAGRVARQPGLRLGVHTSAAGRLDDPPGLMYGLDWVRRAVEGDPRDVLRRGEPALQRLDGAGVTHLLGGNAVAFLGLHRGRRTRARLERFYDRQGMSAPAWMDALETRAT
jgi:hypothetical protein